MKVKNVSERTYIHGDFSLNAGATLVVPDALGKLWIRTGEIIEVEEPKNIQVTIEELGQKPDISKVKLEPKKEVKKSGNNRKRNSR